MEKPFSEVKMKHSTENTDNVLQEFNKNITLDYAWLISYVIFIGVLGIVGNSIAAAYYVKKMDKNVNVILLIVISLNDLISSLVNPVTTVYDFVNSVTYSSIIGCPAIYFAAHVLVINSLLLLTVIGVDRFLQIYLVASKLKFQKSHVVRMLACIFSGSLLIALRDIWIVKPVPVSVHAGQNLTVTGHHCMHSKEDYLKPVIYAFHIIDLVTVIGLSVALTCMYIMIRRKIDRTHKAVVAFSNPIDTRAVEDEVECTSSAAHDTDEAANTCSSAKLSIKDETDSIVKPSILFKWGAHTSEATNDHTHSHKMLEVERRITKMLFVMTGSSLLCFVPYFVVSLSLEYDHESSGWIYLAHRSFLLNSSLNPYVIGYFNSEFRRFVYDIFCRFCFKAVRG
ncbi:5-hydroxytryptamine receptor 1A-beta-like [Mya arenaria]|uniref:5-hydroxytryptamine receptor 1A-beta-like n=1 Tax=Mya arenaria TaxID=6604 RepID=UPI0022E35B58|nr:5-hydroxytryptamine receptor 1A-beta-like [Mya arenaria]